MDNFKEEIVVRKGNVAVYGFLYALCFGVCIVLALIAVLMLNTLLTNFSIPALLITALAGGGAYLLFRYKDHLRIEYEYTFTNGDLDIARVLANTRRKHLLSIAMKDMEAGGWCDGDAANRYLSMPGVKKLVYKLNPDVRSYFLYYSKEGTKTVLIMEPSAEMVKLMVQYAPRVLTDLPAK